MTVRWSPAVIERGEEGYGVVFPDGPGCVVAGDTVEQALSDAAAALAAHLDLLAREGEPLPEPGPADAPCPTGSKTRGWWHGPSCRWNGRSGPSASTSRSMPACWSASTGRHASSA